MYKITHIIRILCVVLTIFLFPAISSCADTVPITTDFKVGTYYYEDFTFPLDDVIPWEQLDYICYSFVIPNKDGSLILPKYPEKLKEMVDKGHAHNVKILISTGGYWYKDIYLAPIFEEIAASETLRTTFIDNLMGLVNEYNLDGIDIDWEYPNPASAQHHEALMLDLSARLKPQGKLLSAAVMGLVEGHTGATSITDKSVATMDLINVMCYDFKTDKNHSPMRFSLDSMKYWTSRAPKENVILGVPFYARPSWQQYRILVEMDPFNATIDAFPDKAGNKGLDSYYNGMPYIERKTMAALENAGGIFSWEINMDTRDEYSLMNLIDRTVKGYQKGYNHQVSVVIDHKMIDFNDDLGQPFLDENNRVMIPVRKLGQVTDAEIFYDDQLREAQVTMATTNERKITMRLPMGTKYVFLDDLKVQMDTESVIKNDRIYIPLRIFFESFGYEVTWDGNTKTAYAELHR